MCKNNNFSFSYTHIFRISHEIIKKVIEWSIFWLDDFSLIMFEVTALFIFIPLVGTQTIMLNGGFNLPNEKPQDT